MPLRFRVGRIVHRQGEYATFTTLTVRDLLYENRDYETFVRNILEEVRRG